MLVSGLEMKNFQVLRNKISRIGASGFNYQLFKLKFNLFGQHFSVFT